jgi:glycosyltransferase involved in cell wall biosynthesis
VFAILAPMGGPVRRTHRQSATGFPGHKRVKVLLATNVFLPEFFGGTETLVHGVALALKRRGHAVVVVTGYPPTAEMERGEHFDEYEIDTIRVVRYKSRRTLPSRETNTMRLQYVDRSFEIVFRRLMDDFAPDIVHFHHLQRLSITAVDVCRERGTPAFLTATDYWYICPTLNLLLNDGHICDGPAYDAANCLQHMAAIRPTASWATRALSQAPTRAIGVGMSWLKNARTSFSGQMGNAQALAQRRGAIADRLLTLDRIFVPTKFMQTVMEKNGLGGVRFRVLSYGLRTQGYNRRIRRSAGGPLVLGFIGSWLPHKGLHVLLEALTRLPETSKIKLKVYGSAPEKGTQYALDLQMMASGDSRVEFCGTFENRHIADVLDGIDALVIPSLWHENMPLVSLSAQAAGCPIVASDVGGIADVVEDGKNGLLFARGSSAELAELILRLLDDDELLPRLSSQAISPTDIEPYIDDLEAEYRRACERLN